MMLQKTEAPLFLSDLFRHALQVVNGDSAVACHLKDHPVADKVAVVAIGKAAAAMMHGADQVLNDQIQSALVITKEGHCDPVSHWPCLQAGHPVPDQRSLDAGTRLLEFIHNLPEALHLLVLVSGGTSALVEVLPENMQLQDLQKLNQWLLASGLPIETMNRIRQSLSKIKGGKLLKYIGCKYITQLLISDVKSDDPAIIGSGLFVDLTMISLSVACAFAADWPGYLGPKRDSTSTEKGLLRNWPKEGPKVLWTAPVGIGYGGPAVSGGKVYLLDRDEKVGDTLRTISMPIHNE